MPSHVARGVASAVAASTRTRNRCYQTAVSPRSVSTAVSTGGHKVGSIGVYGISGVWLHEGEGNKVDDPRRGSHSPASRFKSSTTQFPRRLLQIRSRRCAGMYRDACLSVQPLNPRQPVVSVARHTPRRGRTCGSRNLDHITVRIVVQLVGESNRVQARSR